MPQHTSIRTFCSMLSFTALASAGVSGFATEPTHFVTSSPPLSSVSAADRSSPRFQADLLQSRTDEPSGTAAAISPYFVAAAPANSYQWNMMLEKYLNDPDAIGLARFNYGALHASADDRAALGAYVESLENTDVAALSTEEAIAFWANLYNAVTIKVVIDNYPVKSIREIKSGWRAGPWKRNLVVVDGKKLSLDDIEHDILRKQYPSPLLHYMVNCASIGCPNLKSGLWNAETLAADQDAAARAYINSPRGVRITDKGLKVSSIYKWFKEDFGGSKDAVLAHIRDYADADLATAIDGGAKIVDYGYSWSLNE